MEKKSTLLCSKCNVALSAAQASFSYLERSFHDDVLRCPKCGQVYLPEDFTAGRMSAVESRIEDDYRTLNS